MKKTIMIVSIAVLCIFSLLFIGCNSTNASSTAVTSGSSVTVIDGGTIAQLVSSTQCPNVTASSSASLLFNLTLTVTSGTATVWITNPNGEHIYDQTYNTNANYSTSFTPSVAGTYTFYIRGTENPTGTYSVTLTQTY
ncbi:MAG: hypothetical protein NTX05_02570 [Fusobacteria bacterium]|nr:hypothetical protein [Fusobacteriota bacterium]